MAVLALSALTITKVKGRLVFTVRKETRIQSTYFRNNAKRNVGNLGDLAVGKDDDDGK